MKKILACIFVLVISLCLTSCIDKGIQFRVSYDDMNAFGFKNKDNGIQLFSNAYVTSYEQLITLCNDWNNKTYEQSCELSNLEKLLLTYDEEYFKENDIIIIEFDTGNGIISKVEKVDAKDNKIIVTIKQKQKNGFFTTEAFRWIMVIEISKENTNGLSELEVIFK